MVTAWAASSGSGATNDGPLAPTTTSAPLKLEVIRVDPQRGDDCPTASQVTSAINDRLPGFVGGGAVKTGNAARLLLNQVSPNATKIELISAEGQSVLERTLEILTPDLPDRRADGNRNAAGCAALADTIALIVQRYLRPLEYRDEPAQDQPPVTPRTAKPPPPQPPPATVTAPAPAPTTATTPTDGLRSVLVGGVGDGAGPFSEPWGGSLWTPAAGLSVELGWTHLALSVQGAVGTSVKAQAIPDAQGGTFSYVPVPLRVIAGWRLPFVRGMLAPSLGSGADLLFETSHGLHRSSEFSADPVLEAGANYTLRLGSHAFIGAHTFGVLNLRPHDFLVTGLSLPVLRTPRAYARAGLSFGVAFDVQREPPRH